MRSAVFFAAMIPARRATSSGLPFGFTASDSSTAGVIATKALASASRAVCDFAETSTMRALPASS